jgi:hypothetical protein
MGRVIVVRRQASAYGLGHVGWAYQQNDGSWMCGATENPANSLGGVGDQKGFWAKQYDRQYVPRVFGATRVLPSGTCAPYDDYKIITTGRADSSDALSKACWCKVQPFYVPGRDCLDDDYDILTTYGADLPLPIIAFPNAWFDLISSRALPVPPPGRRPIPATEPTSVPGSAPLWRRPDTDEGRELHHLQVKYAFLRPQAERA